MIRRAIGVVVVLAACGQDPCVEGTLNCVCVESTATCDPGLVCSSGFCRAGPKPPVGGGSGGGGTGSGPSVGGGVGGGGTGGGTGAGPSVGGGTGGGGAGAGPAVGGGSGGGGGVPPPCPSDMAPIGNGGCIDRYEAARSNSTGTSAGTSTTPVSVAGRVPWGGATAAQASTACSSVGKHLCSRTEWFAACTGNPARTYPYGDTYSATLCHVTGSTGSLVTGSHPGCQGGVAGIYDMAGSLQEWNADLVSTGGTGCSASTPCRRVSGSAYFQGDEESKCAYQTTFVATSFGGHIGFRCCK